LWIVSFKDIQLLKSKIYFSRILENSVIPGFELYSGDAFDLMENIEKYKR